MTTARRSFREVRIVDAGHDAINHTTILAESLIRAIRSEIAARVLVIDAKDDTAAAFYRHHGFIQTASEPLTLFLPLASSAGVVPVSR